MPAVILELRALPWIIADGKVHAHLEFEYGSISHPTSSLEFVLAARAMRETAVALYVLKHFQLFQGLNLCVVASVPAIICIH